MVEMTMKLRWSLKGLELARTRNHQNIRPHLNLMQEGGRETLLLQVLNGTEPEMRIAGAIPMYVTVPNEGEVKATNQLQDMGTNVNITDIRGTFNTARMTINNSTQLPIWTTQMDFHPRMASFSPPKTHFPYAPGSNLDYVEMIAFVDRVFPSFIPVQFVQGGIIASYIALVLLVGRLIRGVVTSGPLDVIISEIPNPDYLLKICLDIYLVRESGSRDGNFTLEQDLFAKLIFLFRSPQTLIKWTRYKHIQKGYEFEIKHSWDGKVVPHEPFKISMRWHFERQPGKPHKRVIRVEIRGPLFDDPDPPNEYAGPTPGLWNYEVVELFFANEKGHYLEVEYTQSFYVGPHGHWLVLLHSAYRECFNKGEETELEVQNVHQGAEWICNFEIPLAYMPGNVTKFNAYAIHGSGVERHYEALYAVTDGTFKEPDFHKLQFFGRIDTRRLIPEGYNRQAFNDMKYGDMWECVKKAEKES
uniref:Piezo non-specific cation channel R-Ras-binding domain-containing protein n=1 Tax=Ditylenchus dipsaci TaxID=166011 RepID=A0A915EFL0_9BILA